MAINGVQRGRCQHANVSERLSLLMGCKPSHFVWRHLRHIMRARCQCGHSDAATLRATYRCGAGVRLKWSSAVGICKEATHGVTRCASARAHRTLRLLIHHVTNPNCAHAFAIIIFTSAWRLRAGRGRGMGEHPRDGRSHGTFIRGIGDGGSGRGRGKADFAVARSNLGPDAVLVACSLTTCTNSVGHACEASSP